jgi:hypothetical protein
MEEFYLINPPTQDQTNIVNLELSGWPEIDLFSHWHRKMPYSQLSTLLEQAWSKTPYNTLKLLFYLRNCHGGKGERRQFYQGVRWFMDHHPEQILINFHLLPHFGYWKDLLNLWDSKSELLRANIVYAFCQQLKKDLQALSTPSLASKWAPTEKGADDRKWGFVGLFCEQLGWSRKVYRQNISKLRDALYVTERLASDRRWGEMDFPEIPAKSRMIFHQTLQKYCGHRYEKWCHNHQPPTHPQAPYDIMALLRSKQNPSQTDSEWNEFNKTFDGVSFGDTLCVCDTSPSMESSLNQSPLNPAMALTLLISSHSSEQFRGKVITFSEQPELVNITGSTPTEQVCSLRSIQWGYSINIKAVLQLFIEKKIVPKQLFIFTDRNYSSSQFPHRYEHEYKEIMSTFKDHGLSLPERVYFWNLGGRWGSCSFNLDHHDQGLIIINGFTHEMFTTVTQTGKLYPWLLLKKLLDSDVYSKIRLV